MSKSPQYYRTKRNQVAKILSEIVIVHSDEECYHANIQIENEICNEVAEKILLKFGISKPNNF